MKAEPLSLLKLFHNLNNEQFVIPIYQRPYSWKEEQCEQLWNDLIRAGKNNDIKEHFMGSVVYIEGTDDKEKVVIDGQQRLTTSILLIKVLMEYIESLSEDVEIPEGFSCGELQGYLFNIHKKGKGDFYYKLKLSKSDISTFWSVLNDEIPISTDKERVIENHRFFKKSIEKDKKELTAICKGLEKLTIINVSLMRGQDDPQKIFESMNSTGLDLKQSDLIRNFILMDLESAQQSHLYETYWRKIEESFGDKYEEHFDLFMRHFLTTKTDKIPKINAVYKSFKDDYAGNKEEVQKKLEEMKLYADYYRLIVLGFETHNELKVAFLDLVELKVDVAYPFLLDAYHHYKQGILTSDEMLEIVRLVESYVFRRSICAIPTNSLNKIFVRFISISKQDNYLEAVKIHFLSLSLAKPSGELPNTRFPNDIDFQRELKERDLYNIRNKLYWLRRLENHNNKQPINAGSYTIEHIMPQNQKLSKEWQAELGLNWEKIKNQYLHTLGNLTLTGYNSEYKDYPFEYKQHKASDKKGNKVSFDATPLRLVQWEFELDMDDGQGNIEKKRFSLANVPQWNEVAIKARAECLAEKAIDVWHYPQVRNNVIITPQADIDDNEDDNNA